MKEVLVKVRKYACENCGTKHNNKSAIHKCYISGKEICDKCGGYLSLIPIELFGDTTDYADMETQKYFVAKEYLDNQWDEERYWAIAHRIKIDYIEKMQQLNLAFGCGKITEFLNEYPQYKENENV